MRKFKKVRNTINVTIFYQYPNFSYGGSWYDILLFYFLAMLHPQNFHNKFYVVNCYWFLIATTTLNYALKKKQPKNQLNKIMCERVNFSSPNLTKPKRKPSNTTKCHNIFTIPLFSVLVNFIDL